MKQPFTSIAFPRFFLLACIVFFVRNISSAQQQSADDEGGTQASLLKKLDKKAKYGAGSIKNTVTFGTAKGITGEPVVTAIEDGVVDMVSLENNANVGYLLPYNQFAKLTGYDFFIWYNKGFKSQKYPRKKYPLPATTFFWMIIMACSTVLRPPNRGSAAG